jgi:deazaflavin-dependent oxidoreductase (nitroreductase family)
MQEQGRWRSRLNDGSQRISPYAEANVVFRAMRRMAGWRPVSWLYARILSPIDRAVSRISGRRMTFVRLVSGLPVLLLTTTGARTGAKRTQPLLYLRERDDLVVIGSNWGQAHNPAWCYNLRANPYAEVTLSGSTYEVIAREVTQPQRDLYWQQGCRMYPAWNLYKIRSPHRQFPIMILSKAA